MDEIKIKMEVDRALGVIKGFGWEHDSTEVGTASVKLVIKKKIVPDLKQQRVIEVERVVNVVKGFGWDRKMESFKDDFQFVGFEKALEITKPEGGKQGAEST